MSHVTIVRLACGALLLSAAGCVVRPAPGLVAPERLRVPIARVRYAPDPPDRRVRGVTAPVVVDDDAYADDVDDKVLIVTPWVTSRRRCYTYPRRSYRRAYCRPRRYATRRRYRRHRRRWTTARARYRPSRRYRPSYRRHRSYSRRGWSGRRGWR